MQEIVTIKDVAHHAGVAVSTVSRVINNLDRVSPETRERVLAAIEELGYIRNDIAASIKTGTTKFIVTVVPDIINEFYTAVIRGVEEIARPKGYYTLVYAVNEYHSDGTDVFDERFSRMVDGMILVPPINGVNVCRNFNKPVVLIDRIAADTDGYSVTIDNYRGSQLLMEELIQNHHEKIAFIYGVGDFNVASDRLQAYRDTLSENKLPIREEYICRGDWYHQDGYRFAAQLMALDDPPTAIFAANNQIGHGCAAYLLEHGYKIGTDISLVAFDDSILAPYLGPGITSIDRPTFEMGRIGAEILLALLNGQEQDLPQKTIKLDVQLIRRNSVVRL